MFLFFFLHTTSYETITSLGGTLVGFVCLFLFYVKDRSLIYRINFAAKCVKKEIESIY